MLSMLNLLRRAWRPQWSVLFAPIVDPAWWNAFSSCLEISGVGQHGRLSCPLRLYFFLPSFVICFIFYLTSIFTFTFAHTLFQPVSSPEVRVWLYVWWLNGHIHKTVTDSNTITPTVLAGKQRRGLFWQQTVVSCFLFNTLYHEGCKKFVLATDSHVLLFIPYIVSWGM